MRGDVLGGMRKYREQRAVNLGQLSRKGRRDECGKKDLLLERAVGRGKKRQVPLSVPQYLSLELVRMSGALPFPALTGSNRKANPLPYNIRTPAQYYFAEYL